MNFPKGPDSITHKQTIKLSSRNKGFDVVTNPGLVANLDSPWFVEGYILPQGNHQFKFVLSFSGMSDGRSVKFKSEGKLSYAPRTHSLPKTFTLRNYNVINLYNVMPRQDFLNIEALEKYAATRKNNQPANIMY